MSRSFKTFDDASVSGLILLTYLLFISIGGQARADMGGYLYPKKECLPGEQKIECTQWFEKPEECRSFLTNNTLYYISEGSEGASVQRYVFCKRTSESAHENQQAKSKNRFSTDPLINGLIAGLAVAIAVFALWLLRKCHV